MPSGTCMIVVVLLWFSQEACPMRNLDIIFVLDGSGSVGDDFATVKNWTTSLATEFDIENGTAQIGVIQYSYWDSKIPDLNKQPYIRTEIALGQFSTAKALTDAIQSITYQGYTTATAHALNKTVLDFQSSNRWRDNSIKRVMILLTDGWATDNEFLQQSANYVRSLGITTFAVGVGDYIEEELRTIATGNLTSSERVFSVGKFSGLGGIVNSLRNQILNLVLEGPASTSTTTSAEITTATTSKPNEITPGSKATAAVITTSTPVTTAATSPTTETSELTPASKSTAANVGTTTEDSTEIDTSITTNLAKTTTDILACRQQCPAEAAISPLVIMLSVLCAVLAVSLTASLVHSHWERNRRSSTPPSFNTLSPLTRSATAVHDNDGYENVNVESQHHVTDTGQDGYEIPHNYEEIKAGDQNQRGKDYDEGEYVVPIQYDAYDI